MRANDGYLFNTLAFCFLILVEMCLDRISTRLAPFSSRSRVSEITVSVGEAVLVVVSAARKCFISLSGNFKLRSQRNFGDCRTLNRVTIKYT